MLEEDSGGSAPTRESLELEKLRFEIAELEARRQRGVLDHEKTEIEVQELKRPWYRKPQYVLAALPTTLALVGIIAGLYSGYFSEKIASLQQDVTKYEQDKKELLEQNKASQQDLQGLNDRIQQLNTDKGQATAEVQSIRSEMSGLLAEKRSLDKQVALLNTQQGLNQSELLRTQAEQTRLESKKREVEGKLSLMEASLSTADLKSLMDLWLEDGGVNDYDDESEARNQIVSLFKQRPMQQRQYLSFLENYVSDPKISPERYVSVVYLLFELTKEPKWKQNLATLTLAYLRTLKAEGDKSHNILSQIADLKDLEDAPIATELETVVLNELEKGDLGKSNTVSVLWIFFKVSTPRRIGLHRSNPSLYFRVLKLARDTSIELYDNEFDDLRRFSQTAFLAIVAYRIQKQKMENIEKHFKFLARQPSRQMQKLEVPTTRSLTEWKAWAEKPKIKRLVELWFEEDFKTFRDNPDLLNQLVEQGEVS